MPYARTTVILQWRPPFPPNYNIFVKLFSIGAGVTRGRETIISPGSGIRGIESCDSSALIAAGTPQPPLALPSTSIGM